jgi:hypothetical protein
MDRTVYIRHHLIKFVATETWRLRFCALLLHMYRGADKSLARPGRKQPTATEDFDVHVSYL